MLLAITAAAEASREGRAASTSFNRFCTRRRDASRNSSVCRGISDATLNAYPFSAADVKKLTEWKFDKALPNAALKLPVVTNNFKDMIHGIHA